jgi:predicted porin
MRKRYKIGQWFFDFNYDNTEEEFTLTRYQVDRMIINKTKNYEVVKYYDIHDKELKPEELYKSLSQLKRSIFNSINSLIERQNKSIKEAHDE